MVAAKAAPVRSGLRRRKGTTSATRTSSAAPAGRRRHDGPNGSAGPRARLAPIGSARIKHAEEAQKCRLLRPVRQGGRGRRPRNNSSRIGGKVSFPDGAQQSRAPRILTSKGWNLAKCRGLPPRRSRPGFSCPAGGDREQHVGEAVGVGQGDRSQAAAMNRPAGQGGDGGGWQPGRAGPRSSGRWAAAGHRPCKLPCRLTQSSITGSSAQDGAERLARAAIRPPHQATRQGQASRCGRASIDGAAFDSANRRCRAVRA